MSGAPGHLGNSSEKQSFCNAIQRHTSGRKYCRVSASSAEPLCWVSRCLGRRVAAGICLGLRARCNGRARRLCVRVLRHIDRRERRADQKQRPRGLSRIVAALPRSPVIRPTARTPPPPCHAGQLRHPVVRRCDHAGRRHDLGGRPLHRDERLPDLARSVPCQACPQSPEPSRRCHDVHVQRIRRLLRAKPTEFPEGGRAGAGAAAVRAGA